MTSAIRRQLLAACAGALATPCVWADEKVRRIAVLTVLAPAKSKPYLDALFDGLRERGWIEGRNLIIDLRYTNGQPSPVSAATAELLGLKPDVFHAALDYVAKAAAEFVNPPPIIFAIGNNPVGLGLVKSLARPGTKVTGLSAQSYELVPKRLYLLKEALPTSPSNRPMPTNWCSASARPRPSASCFPARCSCVPRGWLTDPEFGSAACLSHDMAAVRGRQSCRQYRLSNRAGIAMHRADVLWLTCGG